MQGSRSPYWKSCRRIWGWGRTVFHNWMSRFQWQMLPERLVIVEHKHQAICLSLLDVDMSSHQGIHAGEVSTSWHCRISESWRFQQIWLLLRGTPRISNDENFWALMQIFVFEKQIRLHWWVLTNMFFPGWEAALTSNIAHICNIHSLANCWTTVLCLAR